MGVFDWFRGSKKPVKTTPIYSGGKSVPVSPSQQKSAKNIGSVYVTPAESSKAGSRAEIVISKPRTPVSGGGGGSKSPTPQTPQGATAGSLISSVEEDPLESRLEEVDVPVPKSEVKPIYSQAKKSVRFGAGVKRDSTAFTFGEDRPQVTETGLLFVTPKEEKALKQTTASSFVGVDNNALVAAEFGSFMGGTPQVTSKLPASRGVYEFNRAQILGRQEQYGQLQGIKTEFYKDPESFIGKEGVVTTDTEITLTPKYFEKEFEGKDFWKTGLTKAKEEFEALPQGQQLKLSRGGELQGATQFGIGIVEFGGSIVGNLGMQTYKEGEKPSLFGRGFKFGGKAGDIMNLPSTMPSVDFLEAPITYVKQKATSPEFQTQVILTGGLLASGGKAYSQSVKASGWKVGTAESLSTFSPLSLKSKVYTPKITSETKLDITGFKKGDITVFSGKAVSEPFKLGGFQKVKGGRGYSTMLGESPFIEVRGGGGIVTSGTRVIGRGGTLKGITGIEGQFKPTKSEAKGLIDFEAFVSPKSTELSIFRSPKTPFKSAGFLKETDYGLAFTSGQRGKFDPKKAFHLEKGSGRLTTFEPIVKGKIYDLSKVLGTPEKSGFVVGRGGALSKTITSTDMLPTQLPLPKLKPVSKSSNVISPKLDTKTSQKLSFDMKPLTSQRIGLQQKEIVNLGMSSVTKQDIFQKQKPRLSQTFSPLLDTTQKTMPKLRDLQFSMLGESFKQPTKERQKQKIRFPTEPTPIIDFGFRGFDYGRDFRIFPPPFALPVLDLLEVKKARKRGKRKLKRRPSLIAAEFGWTAPKPLKAEITGLVARPILRKRRKRK